MSQSGFNKITSNVLPPSVPITFQTQSGTATALLNILNIFGALGVTTSGSGNTVTLSLTGGGFTWTDVTASTQTIVAQNGYATDNVSGVTYTLPATSNFGDTFKIIGKLGLTTITPNAGQQLLISSLSGTVGVTGTAVSTNVGDSITFVCIVSGSSSVWRTDEFVGNWSLT